MNITESYYYYTEVYRSERTEYTKKCADYYFERYVAPYIGSKDISKITPSELQVVLNKLKGKSKTAISIIYGDLMLIMRRAYIDGYLKRDPSGSVIKPKAKPTEIRRALTRVERETVISAAQTKDEYMAFLFMILCGARPSEAYAIRKEDIDFEEGTVHIKGTKTACSDRVVPCPSVILTRAEKSLYGFITTSKKGDMVTKEGQRGIWRRFVKDCDKIMNGCFGKDLTAYNLRHEYCTELARRGVDIRITQKLMGHSSPEMTLKVYTNLSSDDINTDDLKRIINNSAWGSLQDV